MRNDIIIRVIDLAFPAAEIFLLAGLIVALFFMIWLWVEFIKSHWEK